MLAHRPPAPTPQGGCTVYYQGLPADVQTTALLEQEWDYIVLQVCDRFVLFNGTARVPRPLRGTYMLPSCPHPPFPPHKRRIQPFFRDAMTPRRGPKPGIVCGQAVVCVGWGRRVADMSPLGVAVPVPNH